MKKLKKRQKKKLLMFITIGIIVLASGIGYFVLNGNSYEKPKDQDEPPEVI